jgi:hypothetical protein
MDHDSGAYGLWMLVIFNSAIFLIFAFSFFKPQTARDWRTFSAFAAFIVALFVEMYGFPLNIYLMSGWLQTKYPGLDLLSHNSGHLWSTLLGSKGDRHSSPLHIASYFFPGLWLLPPVQRLVRPVQRATQQPHGHVRPVCTDTASPVRGVRAGADRLSPAMAYLVDAAHVPHPAGHVRTACHYGGS